MKVTNSEIIKSGERELIDTIIADLDWDMIEKIVKDRHQLKIQDDIDYRQGDIVVHNHQVAYRLDFDVKMTLSIIFDRDGNYLSLNTSDDLEDEKKFESGETPFEEGTDESDTDEPSTRQAGESFSPADTPTADPEKAPSENFSKMASHIANMISEINDD